MLSRLEPADGRGVARRRFGQVLLSKAEFAAAGRHPTCEGRLDGVALCCGLQQQLRRQAGDVVLDSQALWLALPLGATLGP